MKKNNRAIHGTRLVVTNAIASAMLLVYGRSAYAGTCIETPVASGNWVCSGAAGPDVTQPIIGAPVTVTTTPGFGINTAAGNALTISGNGGLSFTDAQSSSITAANAAIHSVNNTSGSLNITTNGTAIGGVNGIYARNYGTGATSITAIGAISGTVYSGINVHSFGDDLSINAVDVTGGLRGISAANLGSGSTFITTTGTITGTIDIGISGTNAGFADDLIIAANNVVGGQLGIRTQNFGTGETIINSTGTVTGTTATGIYAINVGAATNLTITANNVYGGQSGILVNNSGTGATTVSTTGAVVGNTMVGIGVTNIGTATDLTITAANVTGGNGGIGASNRGTGATTIIATGTITGTQYFGIAADNTDTSTDLTITAADVTGGRYGIRAFAYGTGANTVTATGTVTGTAIQGIVAQNNVAGTDLTITAVDVTGGQFGIGAFNQGTGLTTVTSTGTVTGTTYRGIDARTFANGLTINAVDVTGGQSGIYAINIGTGATTVTTTGTVTGTNNFGILATMGPYGSDITIYAADVSGGRYGISASNYGTGATTVTSTGTVTGSSIYGILAQNTGNATSISVSAIDVTGAATGLRTINNGSGATNITTTGTVTGTYGPGIYARNNASSTDLIINAANVIGGSHGINARNFGTGTTNVTTTGLVTGGTFSSGIYARNSGTGLTITATDVTGGQNGIQAFNHGTGAMNIITTGMITGTGSTGIYASNNSGTDILITANNVTGGQVGIRAVNYFGTGSTEITSTGTVVGSDFSGIFARSGAATTGLTINTVDVSGGMFGINAQNSGTGTTAINSTGTAYGDFFGIYARNTGSATGLTINSVEALGGSIGISARNNANGAITINATGTSTGTGNAGIYVRNYAPGSAVTITAADVVGGNNGFDIRNYGNGATNITVSGTVSADNFAGINVFNNTNTNGLGINAVDVAGGLEGIYARNFGTGATTINTAGTVTGTLRHGIYASNGTTANGLTITTNNVTGGTGGILANNYGFGATTINSTGTVSANLFGISARNQASAGNLTISAHNITGAIFGIAAVNYGSSPTTINLSGAITGGSAFGIYSVTTGGSLTTINLASTSSVSSTYGHAIGNYGGDSIVNVSSGALINGSVTLNEGSDTVNIAGGTNLSGITLLDGGDDTALGDGFIDILNLNSAWSGNLNGANIFNWEFININGGNVGFSNAAITAGQINVNNFGSLNGSNNLNITGIAAVASGSRIIAGNASGTNAMNISGNLFNAGNVQLSGPAGHQAAGDRLTVAGNYFGSGGTLVLDTVLNSDTSTTDRLVVAGNTSGSTGIIVNNVGGLGAMTTGDGIMLVNVAGTSAANAFNLNNPVVAGAFNYRLYQNGINNPADGDWYLRSSARGITPPAIVLSTMANKIGLSMLGTRQERFGMSNVEFDGGAWIRIVGNAGSQMHESNIGNFEGRNDSSFIQTGVDLHRTENTRWGTFVAKTISTTHMFDPSIDLNVEVGKASLDGYALGGYATYFTDTYYWDAVIQQSWLDAIITGDADSFKTANKNWLASFEFGRSFELGNNAIEPQAQIIAGNGVIDDVTDGITSYNYSDQKFLVGRLGIRWTHAKDEVNLKGRFVPFLKANISRDFGDDSHVQIGVSDITTERNDTRAEIGFGFSVLTQHDWSVFMQYDYEKGLGYSDLENYSGTIGLRRNW